MNMCLSHTLHRHSFQHYRLQADFPAPVLVLGHAAEDLRVHLRLHHARPHHHHLLWSHDTAAQECADAFRHAGKINK